MSFLSGLWNNGKNMVLGTVEHTVFDGIKGGLMGGSVIGAVAAVGVGILAFNAAFTAASIIGLALAGGVLAGAVGFLAVGAVGSLVGLMTGGAREVIRGSAPDPNRTQAQIRAMENDLMQKQAMVHNVAPSFDNPDARADHAAKIEAARKTPTTQGVGI